MSMTTEPMSKRLRMGETTTYEEMDTSVSKDEAVFSLEKRDRELRNIVSLAGILAKILNVTLPANKDSILDMDLSNQFSGALAAFYSYLRKLNNVNKTYARKMESYCIVMGKVTKSLSIIHGEYLASKIDFDFKIATPLVHMLTVYRMVYEEVRLGVVSGLTINDITRRKNISHYGLNESHIPLLTGITYSPEHRSGLTSCLGPMTLAILLVNERHYTDKLVRALKDSISFIPEADAIIKFLKKSTEINMQVKEILRKLGDILIITGSRSSNKIHYPFFLFYVICKNEIPNWFSFAGHKTLINLTKHMKSVQFVKNSKGSTEHLSQICFHAMYGTYLEDFGILKSITGVDFLPRSAVSVDFKKSVKPTMKTFSIIEHNYVSKLASANLFSDNTNNKPMICCKMVYSGHREKVYSENFLNYITQKDEHTFDLTDYSMLIYKMEQYRISLVKDVRLGQKKSAGTTSWFSVATGDEDINFKPIETNKYFY